MEDFATRKSSNEHEFFVAVTSLNKIGEERIQDLTGDIPFPVTFKYPVQRPSKSDILVKSMTQFLTYIELNSTSLQLSGSSWISNCRPMPRMVILNTRFGLLNMILSPSLNMVVETILQNVRWSLPGISAFCSSVFFLLMSKDWTWKWRCILTSTFVTSRRDCPMDREHNALQKKKERVNVLASGKRKVLSHNFAP